MQSAFGDGRQPQTDRWEIRNCSAYLKRVLELIDPPIIVATLGSVALAATNTIEDHGLKLKEDAGSVQEWNGRKLVPLYHPSPQVIASQRGTLVQLKHFETLKTLIFSEWRKAFSGKGITAIRYTFYSIFKRGPVPTWNFTNKNVD